MEIKKRKEHKTIYVLKDKKVLMTLKDFVKDLKEYSKYVKSFQRNNYQSIEIEYNGETYLVGHIK